MAALQASQMSRDQMLDNIHYFRVRDYTEQVSTLCRPVSTTLLDLQEWSRPHLDHDWTLSRDLSVSPPSNRTWFDLCGHVL